MKALIKRFLIAGYSYGLLPMDVVACGFNYFRLEAV